MLRKPVFLHLFSVIFALCLVLPGCQTRQPTDSTAPAASSVTEELRSGQLSVQLILSSSQISIADHLQLTLTATAPEDLEISFPEFTGSVGDFTLAGTASAPKELVGAQIRQSRTLTLSPYLPGQYAIPAMKVSAKDKRAEDRLAEVTIPARTIAVTSFLQSDEKDPQIADIYPPVPQPLPTYYYLLAGGAVVLGFALLYYFLRRRKMHQPPPPPVPLHVGALAEIDQLLLEQGKGSDFAYFYSRLTLILRHYIEARFGLKAAEQTTEQFLESMKNSSFFTGEQKELFRGFLGRCDLIKFARIIPARQEVDDGIELCRDFIRASGEKIEQRTRQEGAR